jgi:hypothetical protein
MKAQKNPIIAVTAGILAGEKKNVWIRMDDYIHQPVTLILSEYCKSGKKKTN